MTTEAKAREAQLEQENRIFGLVKNAAGEVRRPWKGLKFERRPQLPKGYTLEICTRAQYEEEMKKQER